MNTEVLSVVQSLIGIKSLSIPHDFNRLTDNENW